VNIIWKKVALFALVGACKNVFFSSLPVSNIFSILLIAGAKRRT
jgi:hypothetical protein